MQLNGPNTTSSLDEQVTPSYWSMMPTNESA